jgi:predicted GH43/DUF377 family glycosyl hydrolase
VSEAEETEFRIERLGVIMEEDPGNPDEAWGVLNPGSARGRDGELYLFPRVVAEGNYSRIGVARVLYDAAGEPTGVERLGYALEPTASYERNERTAGCEDPRVVHIEELDAYVMTYTAYGPVGPRIALAVSHDLFEWRRLGVAKFAPALGVEFDFYDNKDALIFPRLIADPAGRPSVALIHRPSYNLARRGQEPYQVVPDGVTEERPSMWISYCPVERLGDRIEGLTWYSDHRLLAVPEESWQSLKIGGGTPPVLTKHGWLTLFHGVSGRILEGVDLQPGVSYAAGALVLDRDNPTKVLYRSRTPILEPRMEQERQGIVANVVFPTAVDQREGGRLDVYYGMADARIGVGRLQTPEALPLEGRDQLVA